MGSAEDLDGDGIGDVMPQERAASSERKPRNGDRQTVAPSPAHGCGSADGTKLQIPVQIGDRLTDETGEGDGGVMKHMLVAAACVVLLGTAACSVTTGVSFPNARLGSGSTMQINGLLAKPEGNGPFPAVVLLHTCGGVEDHTKWVWPDALRQKGYVTLTVDSFGSRGLGKCPNALVSSRVLARELDDAVSGGSALLDLSADAFGGLDYLASLPFVDKERIGVVGFSLGGWVIKDGILAYALVRPQGASRFKAAVSLYGSCGSYFRGFNGSYPFHLLEIAGENDINILKECRTVKNPEFEMRVLPGAYHAWDQADATTIRPDVRGNPRLYDSRATKESEKIVLEFLAKNLP